MIIKTSKEADKPFKIKEKPSGKFPEGQTRDKEIRTSGFIHIGEIIPGVLKDIERKIKENTKREKGSNVKIHIASFPEKRRF